MRFLNGLLGLGFDSRAAEKYDSHVYALVIAIGVPLMAGFVPDFYTKLAIACVWFAIAPLAYFWLEGMEIVHQILRHGVLDQPRSDAQRRSMYDLYYGVIFALVVWLVVYVAFVASSNGEYEGLWGMVGFIVTSFAHSPLNYGVIEVAILAQTILVGRFAIHVFYALITAFLQATAGQKRYETEVQGAPPLKE